MDKKTSISTVILVLLVILTLVSLSASAYLYFTFNPLNANTEEKMEGDEYKGGDWDNIESNEEDFCLTIRYPNTWVRSEQVTDIRDTHESFLQVSTPANENDQYDDFVHIKLDPFLFLNEGSSLLDYVENRKVDVESGDEEFTFDYELTQKWGEEVYSYTHINGSDYGEERGYILSRKGLLYDISYRNTTGDDNTQKVLDSITFWSCL